MEDVISRKLTIDEAIRDGAFSLLAKQRMKIMHVAKDKAVFNLGEITGNIRLASTR